MTEEYKITELYREFYEFNNLETVFATWEKKGPNIKR